MKGSDRMKAALAGVLILVSPFAWGFDVEVSSAPENDLALTVKAIQNARQSIYLNIYELTSAQIADALKGRIRAGVTVSIIEEGQPVGGLSAAAKGIEADLIQTMQGARSGSRFFEMISKAGSSRRFHYDHAKYAVIDEQSVLIGSENYSPTGNPAGGSLGNRGWEVWIHEPRLAQDYLAVFQNDSNASNGDILDLTRGTPAMLEPIALESFLAKKPGGGSGTPSHGTSPGTPPSQAPGNTSGQVLQASAVQRVTSPDTSLSGLVTLIQQAKTSLDIQQMTFDPAWGPGGRSPLLDAVISAARRGVSVRVLLNDESVFNHPGHPAKPKNTATVDELNRVAQSEGLRLSARIADLKAMGVDYIHNKGMLVDNDRTLISSINWDENAVEKNREAAVVITSPAVHSYYEQLFTSDWNVSLNQAQHKMALIASIPPSLQRLEGEAVIADCPAKIHMMIQVGKLSIEDQEDSDFEAISERKIEGDFTRTPSPHSCVLVDSDSSRETRERRVLEIRERADGSRTVNFEGYTPTNQKIYSIRATLQSKDFRSENDAIVYDGSGPTKEKLGTATIELK